VKIEAKADRLNVNTARATAKKETKSEKAQNVFYVTHTINNNGK
jgi:hypothetical protein